MLVSTQILLLLVELGNGAIVFEALMKASIHKTNKIRAAAITAISRVVCDFGSFPGLPLKPLLKSVCVLCNDTDGKVRKEALALCVEFYKYLGEGVKAFLADLRDVQMAELEKEFLAVNRSAVVPTRTIRGCAAAKVVKDDLRDLHDASAVISKLPKTFFTVVNDKALKWQDRNAMVQDSLTRAP